MMCYPTAPAQTSAEVINGLALRCFLASATNPALRPYLMAALTPQIYPPPAYPVAVPGVPAPVPTPPPVHVPVDYTPRVQHLPASFTHKKKVVGKRQNSNKGRRRCKSELTRTFSCDVDNCTRRYEAFRSLQHHYWVAHNLKRTKSEYAKMHGITLDDDEPTPCRSNSTTSAMSVVSCSSVGSPEMNTDYGELSTPFGTPCPSGPSSPCLSPVSAQGVQEHPIKMEAWINDFDVDNLLWDLTGENEPVELEVDLQASPVDSMTTLDALP